MIFNICLTIFSIHIIQTIIRIEDNWFLWDISLIVNIIAYNFIALTILTYKQLKEKVAITLLLLYNLWTLIDYLIIYFFESYTHTDILRNVTLLTSFFLFVPSVFKILHYNFSQQSDKYIPKSRCYLVYRYPRRFQEIVTFFLYNKTGSVYLIVNGREFKYVQGILKERAHVYSERNTYKEIGNVNIKEIRKLRGQKWTLKNNCFNTFTKFNNRKIHGK